MKNTLTEKLTNITDNLRHNAAIYAGAGLMMLYSCNSRYSKAKIVEYDGNIGKTHVYAEKNDFTRKGATHSYYSMLEVLEDGTKINYKDHDNDKNIDQLSIVSPSGVREIVSKDRELFNAANNHYQHLRDTIPVLNNALKKNAYDNKAKSDAVKAKKYFGN